MNKNNKFQQISRSERSQIYALKKAGLSADLIAGQLGRHRSTIYRELSRNRCYYDDEKKRSSYLPKNSRNQAINR